MARSPGEGGGQWPIQSVSSLLQRHTDSGMPSSPPRVQPSQLWQLAQMAGDKAICCVINSQFETPPFTAKPLQAETQHVGGTRASSGQQRGMATGLGGRHWNKGQDGAEGNTPARSPRFTVPTASGAHGPHKNKQLGRP